jgi:NAD(P)-dependent dehydrogenase (short-subunit alcohol dehydrogenase family)
MPAGSEEKKDQLAGDYERIAKEYGEGLRNKYAIVTGGNSGLGYEMARALSAAGVNVIVATRNPEKGEGAVQDLQSKETSSEKGTLEFMHLDLASLKSVQSFAEEFKKKNKPLHILANNAASFLTPESNNYTEDGFEFQVASNYFGHLYLTELLKDKLVSSAPSRIVFTTSAAETYGTINWENLEMTDRDSGFKTYGTVKLYTQMLARYLGTKLKGENVEVYSGQPGLSSTGFFDPSKFDWLKPAATSQWLAQKFIALTVEEGAWPIIFSAIAPKDQLQGAETGLSMGPEYYDTGVAQLPQITNKGLIRYNEPQNDDLKDPKQCEKLYKESIKILKSKPVVSSGPQFGLDGV